MPAGPRFARGVTMVEVLIAIVILSIGVLGALGMQVNAIRMNKEVRYQATALTLARELAEKMRGNNWVAILTTPGTLVGQNPYLLNVTLNSGATVSAPSGVNCYTGACTTQTDVAKWDIYDWQLRMKEALPSPRVVICMDSDPYDGSGNPRWACNNTGTVAVLKVAWNRAATTQAVGRGDVTTSQIQLTSDANTLPMLTLPLTAGSPE
jgi:type IV pilus assembly protein PilV